MDSFECPLCSNFKFSRYIQLLKHLRTYHPKELNVSLHCKVKSCGRDFTLRNSFYKHLKSEHMSKKRSPDKNFTSRNIINNDFENFDSFNKIFEGHINDLDISSISTDTSMETKLDNLLGDLYNKLHLTNKDIDYIISSFKNFCPELERIDTLKKRINYFKQRNVYLKPNPIVLGTSIRAGKARPDSIQYISLIGTMKKIFSCNEFFQACKEYMSMQPENQEILGDFKDASTFRASVESDKIKFPFVIYFDDFESGNPLGSKRGIHKIGGVYMALRCCDPFFYSKVNLIHLIMLMLSKHREKYGNKKIFDRLIQDINYLENHGIIVNEETVKFKFIGFNGDNLGLHSLLGFSESFSADYSCRFCKIKKKDLHKSCCLDQRILRTPENYKIGEEGVMSSCAFNRIDSFHCTTNYVVDAMHDIYNGVAIYVLCKVLKFYIDNKYFTLKQLNDSLDELNLSQVNRSNKPTSVREQNLLRGSLPLSCSETKIFLYYIPVLIGEFVPEDCQHWRLVLLLREIALITSAKKICTSSLDYLDSVVSEHNQLYLDLFKDPLKPKFHYLLHYKDIILKSGPMSHLWSFRFEAKHQTLKEYANVCKSRVDICMSIANRIQMMMAASLNSAKTCNISPSLSKKTSENSYKILEYRGIRCKVDNFILVDYNDNYPTFGKIKSISYTNNKIVIDTLLYKTLDYNHHLDSFMIEYSETTFKLMVGSDLREPVMKYSLNNYEYVMFNKYEY